MTPNGPRRQLSGDAILLRRQEIGVRASSLRRRSLLSPSCSHAATPPFVTRSSTRACQAPLRKCPAPKRVSASGVVVGHAQYTPAPDGLARRRCPYAQVVAAHNLSNKTIDSVAHEGLVFQEDMEATGA